MRAETAVGLGYGGFAVGDGQGSVDIDFIVRSEPIQGQAHIEIRMSARVRQASEPQVKLILQFLGTQQCVNDLL